MTAYLARYPGQRVAVALEQKRGALLYMLMKYEQVVLYPIHGATASKFRAALYPSGSKDDPKDAELLLDLLTQHRDHIRRLDPDTEETRKLQLLVEKRRTLVDERTRQSLRLMAELKVYFPQLLGWFPDAQSPLMADFLNRCRYRPATGAHAAGCTARPPGYGAPFPASAQLPQPGTHRAKAGGAEASSGRDHGSGDGRAGSHHGACAGGLHRLFEQSY